MQSHFRQAGKIRNPGKKTREKSKAATGSRPSFCGKLLANITYKE